MNAKITYYMPRWYHPFDELRNDELVWCLIKRITPEYGHHKDEAIAIFNSDFEAETFQGHIFASGLILKQKSG